MSHAEFSHLKRGFAYGWRSVLDKWPHWYEACGSLEDWGRYEASDGWSFPPNEEGSLMFHLLRSEAAMAHTSLGECVTAPMAAAMTIMFTFVRAYLDKHGVLPPFFTPTNIDLDDLPYPFYGSTSNQPHGPVSRWVTLPLNTSIHDGNTRSIARPRYDSSNGPMFRIGPDGLEFDLSFRRVLQQPHIQPRPGNLQNYQGRPDPALFAPPAPPGLSTVDTVMWAVGNARNNPPFDWVTENTLRHLENGPDGVRPDAIDAEEQRQGVSLEGRIRTQGALRDMFHMGMLNTTPGGGMGFGSGGGMAPGIGEMGGGYGASIGFPSGGRYGNRGRWQGM
ncbi:hypothetical protein P7C73_g1148, partial [Tremellales sp. Uapishka_1]